MPVERRASLLRRVRTRLSIHAHRRVRGLLDGEYTSVFHGRSLEFDDLRPYVAGDEVKDVDWKATARLNTLMTRRYVASRKHTLLLIVDTGRAMAATAASGESKRELAVLAAGTIGYIAVRHGDLVSLVSGDAEHTRFVAPQSTESNLERILQTIDAGTSLDGAHSDLERQLAYAGRVVRGGRIVVVIADDRPLSPTEQQHVRRLAVRHEVLWITVADADLMGESSSAASMSDVDTALTLPSFVRTNPALRAEFEASVATQAAESADLFDALAVSSQRVTSAEEVVPGIFRLLQLHKSSRSLARARR